ncbi:MAG: Na/Pi cotransporter family protein, partial [Oscillospiraceae bacterium]|nr:Na/Pi cotransporter family protein [Oscillospiraceae bacterium]
KQLEKLACFIVKDSKEDIEKDEEFKVLDDRFIHSPAFAIEQCKKLTDNMADITRDSMLRAVEITNGYNEELDKYIYETESRIDNYEDKLGTYLVKISANELSAEDGKNISTLLHCIGDFERISDHATNIVKASKEMNDKGIVFSGDAKKELDIMSRAVADVLNLTVEAFINNDLEKAHKVEPLEEVIDGLKTRLKSRHVKRLRDGECTIELGFVFADFITNFERVSDHCSNIAVCLIQMADANFEVHDYIHELKASGEEFEKMVEEYQQIYKLPAKNF